MNITKCDICKKTINKGQEKVYADYGLYPMGSFEICSDCGKPVIEFLKNKKLIEKKSNKKI